MTQFILGATCDLMFLTVISQCLPSLTSCTIHLNPPRKKKLCIYTWSHFLFVLFFSHPSRLVHSSWSTCAWWSSPPSSQRPNSGSTSWCRSKGRSACPPPPWPAWLSLEIATRRSSSWSATSSARLRGDRQLSTTRWGASPRQLVEVEATGVVGAMWTESGIIPGTQDVSRRTSAMTSEYVVVISHLICDIEAKVWLRVWLHFNGYDFRGWYAVYYSLCYWVQSAFPDFAPVPNNGKPLYFALQNCICMFNSKAVFPSTCFHHMTDQLFLHWEKKKLFGLSASSQIYFEDFHFYSV